MKKLSQYFPDAEVLPVYQPAMMQYDGSTGYYYKTFTTSGNKIVVLMRFKCEEFSGDTFQVLATLRGSSTRPRAQLIVYSSDYSADTARRNKVVVVTANSAGTHTALLLSDVVVCDGNKHTLLYSFDADAGAATFIIDGAAADDTSWGARVEPTTGTLDSGSGGFSFGASDSSGSFKFAGEIGFIGYADAYQTNWSDFMDANGYPIKQDETTWANSGWGSQPLLWNEHGFMEDNKGSAGDMTKNGTIVVADQNSTFYGWFPTYVPQIVDTYIESNSDNSTTQPLNVPAHAVGDLLVAVVMHRSGGGVLTPPAGWDTYGLVSTVAGYQYLTVFTRVATVSEPASYTWSTASSNRIAGFMASVRGVSQIDSYTETSNSDSSLDISVAPYGAIKLALFHWTVSLSAGETRSSTGSGVVSVEDANAANVRLAAAHTIYDTTITFTHSSASDQGAICLALA